MTILYADDDDDDRDLMFEAFNQIDPSISCLIANDGREALEMLNQNSELPDYIFLDINMPVMDGKKCLQELKKDHRLKNIPVVICSTTKDKNEISQLYNLGASSFIHKPDNFNDLCEALNVFVKLIQN
jgi:CheY-like chemotaxis protein